MLHGVAPAKITLTLHITGKRADGYHLLDALVVFTREGDLLHVEAADALSLNVTGPFAPMLSNTAPADNLVLRAAQLLRERTGCTHGARITLEKYLPIASGIGGGSSDAAQALHLLAQLWQLNLSAETLAAWSLELGSDVPACLLGKPVMMRGVGERLSPLDQPLPPFYVLLVNPGVALATPDVYRAFAYPQDSTAPAPMHMDALDGFIASVRAAQNDLQGAAIRLCPVITDVLSALESQAGCHLARLCGSGATCYGLFTDAGALHHAAQMIRGNQPDWWIAPYTVSSD